MLNVLKCRTSALPSVANGCSVKKATSFFLARSFTSSSASAAAEEGNTKKPREPILLVDQNPSGVTTLTMNTPKKLNGWSMDMMMSIRDTMKRLSADDSSKVVILTGNGSYYCAGVNLSQTMAPMHPKKLHSLIEENNRAIFDAFIDFPKPIIIAANGPAIGACVTSATLCDAIIASENATFVTPFAALGIVPEGCSSVHFERIMGKENARKMLDEGWKPTAAEAKEAGFVTEVTTPEQLMPVATKLAETFIKEGRVRNLVKENRVEEYKQVNAEESKALADAFLAEPFLDAQYKFLSGKGKTQPAMLFWVLKATRPLWSKLL
eukprot:Nk52_evm18s913 gene=Nk52_evmTU18s913